MRVWEEIGAFLNKEAECVYEGYSSLRQTVVSKNVEYVLTSCEGWESVSKGGWWGKRVLAEWENRTKKCHSFFFFPSYFILGYSWDFTHTTYTGGIFSNGLYVLDVMFLEQRRFLVLRVRLFFRIEGNVTKGAFLWDRIYNLSRDKVHFPLHFLLHDLKSNKDCRMTFFFLSLMQISADSIKETNFYIIPSSAVNSVGSGTRQTWRIHTPLFISCVTLDKSVNISVPQYPVCKVRLVMLVSYGCGEN